jgi:protein SCO1/2
VTQTQSLDGNTPEEAIAGIVDSVRQSQQSRDVLVGLLPEKISLYNGRSANETIRIRGYILAAFETVGLPEAAVPYVLEELENGRDAYLVAAAAKAVRGLQNPDGRIVSFLMKAVENIKYADDAVTFDCYKPHWPVPNSTTALVEIFRTVAWMGAHAKSALSWLQLLLDGSPREFSRSVRMSMTEAINRVRSDLSSEKSCCCGAPVSLRPVAMSPGHKNRSESCVLDIEIEDQEGCSLKYRDFFMGKVCIAVFFYTRCTNPNKCSLTIANLARLQKAIADQGLQRVLRTAAITYDPDYDLPPRLRAYGENRDVTFDEDHRMFRVSHGFEVLREYFDLNVNFTPSTINRHAIELFIVDASGRIAATFSRLQWDGREVLHQARLLLTLQ